MKSPLFRFLNLSGVFCAVQMVTGTSLRQPVAFSATNEGDLYQGTGSSELAAPGYFSATFKPFPSGLGTLVSYSVGCRIEGDLQGKAGLDGEIGMASGALGGTFAINSLAFNGTGGMATIEAEAGQPLELPFGIPDFSGELLVADAGMKYHPDILGFVIGSSDFDLSFSSAVTISYTNVENLAARFTGELSVTYQYVAADGSGPATLRFTGIAKPAAGQGLTLSWQAASGTDYAVDVTENFSDWTVIAPVIPGSAPETTFAETPPPAEATRRFYRVRQLP